MDLSVIIVSYNTSELTVNTIKSVLNTIKKSTYEIIVVDNASSDDSVKRIKSEFGERVRVIENSENQGFSRANNIAIKQSIGEYVLLLNSDTVVHTDAIDNSLRYIKKYKDIGALGCRVLLRDGKLDKACKRGFPTPWNSLCYALKLDKLFPKVKRFGGYHLNYLDEQSIQEVDCIMGAYMLVPRDVISKVGMLDEDYFMYGEDIDWCYRIKASGFKIIYYPKATISHYKKASFAKRKEKTIKEFYAAMIIFYDKHYKNKYNLLITFMVYLGIKLQYYFARLKNLLKN